MYNWLLVAILLLTGLKVNAQIGNASFAVSKDSICSGGMVYVHNTSPDTLLPGVQFMWQLNGNGSPQNWTGSSVPQGFHLWNTNTYQINLMELDSNGVFLGSFTKDIHVFPEPNWPNLSPNNLSVECGPVFITDNNNTNDIWMNAAGDTLGTGSSITLNIPGFYNVSAISPFGCINSNPMGFNIQQGQTSVNIGSNSMSMPYNNDSIIYGCQGDQVFLNANINYMFNGGGFVWENGSSAWNRTVTQAGYYSLIYTGASGCSITKTVHLIMKPKPHPTITASGPTTRCGNESITFSVTQTYIDYTWNNWNFSSGNQTFISWNSGYNYVVVTDTNGCKGVSDSIFVTENPVPPQATITPSGCNLISDMPNDGIHINIWKIDTLSTIIGSTQMISPMVSGAYTDMIVDVTTGCHSTSLPYSFVLPPVPVIVGNLDICQGDTAHLTIFNPNQYSQFFWSNSADGPIDTATVSGYINVEAQYGSQGGCIVVNPYSVYVTVHPKPIGIITASNTTLCAGDSVTLSVPSGTNDSWSTGEVGSTIYVTNGGYYSALMTNSYGCSYVTPAVHIIEHAKPNKPTITGPCILSTNSGFSSYQWYELDTLLNMIPITSSTGQFLSIVHVPNYYTVGVTDANGCSNTSDPYWSSCGTGINEETNTISEVYPNPFTNQITVRFSDNKEHMINMFDVLGKVVISEKGQNEMTLNTTELSSGIYFIPGIGKMIK